MLHKRSLLFIFSALLSLFLVACGNAEGDNSAESVNLSQSLSYDDDMGGTVTISYPEGWSGVEEAGSANFASSEELLLQAASSDLPDVESGEVIAISLALPSEMVSFFVSGDDEVSVTAIVNSFVSDLISEGEDNTVGEVEETTIDGKSAAVVQATSEDVDVVLVTIDLGDGNYALVFGGTAEGEGDSIRPTIEAIAGSIEYTVADSE